MARIQARMAAAAVRLQVGTVARVRQLRLRVHEEDGLQAAEALMYAFVGVLLLAAVGVALKAAFPGIVTTIVNAIKKGV